MYISLGYISLFLTTELQASAPEIQSETSNTTQLLIIWAIVTGLLLGYICWAWFRADSGNYQAHLRRQLTRKTVFTLGLSSLGLSSAGVLLYKLVSLPDLRTLLGVEGSVALIFGALAFFWDAMEQLGDLLPKDSENKEK
ncbi:MAG: hypothetical protein AAFY26_12355 [Cyanobacteria bacterium J06638_22]